MLKIALLVMLSLALAAAKPSEDVKKRSAIYTADTLYPLAAPLATATVVHEPALAKIGDVVHSVPTAISHQSSTIVHDRANVVTPIVAPAVKTRLTPIIAADYNLPYLRSYPLSYHYPYQYYSYY